MVILDRKSQRLVPLDQSFGEWMRVVGRIVEHLNLQQSLGILDLGDLVDQPLDNIALVINRKLDGDRWQLLEANRRMIDRVLPMLEIGANDVVAMQAVDGENRQDREVRDQQRPVEPAQPVNVGERVIEQALREAADS